MEYKLKNGKKLIVRCPVVQDARGIIEVIAKADTESLFLAREEGEFSTTVEREQSIISSVLESPDEAWFIAEYEGKIVGQCSVGLIRNYLRYRHRAEVAFVILEQYCNLGIGGKMMEECLQWCREHRIKQVELDVVTSNERALNMYKNFGFRIVGTIPNALSYKDGTFADEYRMVKLLGSVELRAINHDNWIECIELEVKDEQRKFVNPNIFSLAESFVHSDANKEEAEEYYRCIPFAIYNDDDMIGFVLISYEKECDFDNKPGYEIYRLMIAKDWQGKGFGRKAIKLVLDYIKTFPYGGAENVYASWHPDNKASERACLGNGFVVVGKDDDGAVISRLNI